ncbi:MAG: STAS domain-containing protein [Planctomycetes bacterium]|nr:STAS domain-containing protein [Planctomycetota bacterium]
MSPQRDVVQLVGSGRIEGIRAALSGKASGIEVRWAATLSDALAAGVADSPPAVLVMEDGPAPQEGPDIRALSGDDLPPLIAVVPPDDASPRALFERGADFILRAGLDAGALVSQLHGLLRLFERLREYARHLHQQVRFLEAVAHDLRSPTAAILGYAEFLKEAIEPARVDLAKDLNRIVENATAIQDLAVEVSSVASETTTGAYPGLDAIDLRMLVGQAIDAVRPAAEARRIVITLDRGGRPVQVIGQRGQLRRVFVNLLENALKFSPEGGRVETSIACAGDRVLVAVEDDGPGIPTEAREAIFRRRIRLHRVPVEGKGLGLAIAREIADLHGGTIRVEDAPGGRGSRFVVELPALAGPLTERIDSPNGAVEIAQTGEGISIGFEGTIAAEDVARYQNRLRSAVDACRDAVTVDLSRVEAIASRGMALLLELKLDAEMRGLSFHFGLVSADVEDALARSGLAEVFGMARSPS